MLFGLGSAVVYTIYFFGMDTLPARTDRITATALICSGAAAAHIVVGSLRGVFDWRPPADLLLWVIAMAGVSTVLAMMMLLTGIRGAGASIASVVSCLEPITAVLLGAVLFADPFGPVQWLGTAGVVGAVVLLGPPVRPGRGGRGGTRVDDRSIDFPRRRCERRWAWRSRIACGIAPRTSGSGPGCTGPGRARPDAGSSGSCRSAGSPTSSGPCSATTAGSAIQFGAGVAYFSVLAIIPVFMVAFSIVGFFLVELRPDLISDGGATSRRPSSAASIPTRSRRSRTGIVSLLENYTSIGSSA